MRTSKAVRLACSVMLVSVLAALAALVSSASAGSAAAPVSTQVPVSKVAGVETTRMYINGFRAVGRKVVGRGTAIATFKNAAGHKTKRTRHFNITIRTARVQPQQEGAICQVLFLQLGELDLTLAGLHAVLHAADPTQPVELRLSADDAGGILGRLFCQLANASGVLGTSQKATLAAKQMNKHLRAATIMRVKAIIYAPSSSGNAGMQAYSPQGLSHIWCTDAPWAYGLSIYHVYDPDSFDSQAPFHPTPDGQNSIATSVLATARQFFTAPAGTPTTHS